jgi:hypothetical protein
MEFRFYCPSCGEKLKAEDEHAGRAVDCPHCGAEFSVPQPKPELPSSPAEPPRDRPFTNPHLDGALTCPVCWLRFDTSDTMHLAVHDLAAELSIHGVEKTDETGHLCRLNLVLHGRQLEVQPETGWPGPTATEDLWRRFSLRSVCSLGYKARMLFEHCFASRLNVSE